MRKTQLQRALFNRLNSAVFMTENIGLATQLVPVRTIYHIHTCREHFNRFFFCFFLLL